MLVLSSISRKCEERHISCGIVRPMLGRMLTKAPFTINSPQIFAQIGIKTGMSLLFQAVNAIIAFAGTTVCILTIDSVGRRPLEIYGCLILCVTFIINAAIIKVFPTNSENTAAHWAFVVLTWLFNFGENV